MKSRTVYILLALFLLIIDQVSKSIVAHTVDIYSIRRIIPGFFNIVHVQNKGAIFGFFSQSGNSIIYIFLTLASFVALSLVLFYFFKTAPSERLLMISLSLILAGALGNLIDRVIRGYVIDFLDVYVRKWHWPSFNIADSCISVGALILVYLFVFKRSHNVS